MGHLGFEYVQLAVLPFHSLLIIFQNLLKMLGKSKNIIPNAGLMVIYNGTNVKTLHTARVTAAEGYLSAFTIPLLAEPETLIQTARLNWVLHLPTLAPTGGSHLLRPTIMVPVHPRPSMPLSVMPPTLRMMTLLPHILLPLPLCNSRTLPLCLETSDAQLQSPPPLLLQMFKPGCMLEQSCCTHTRNINFLEPTLHSPSPP